MIFTSQTTRDPPQVHTQILGTHTIFQMAMRITKVKQDPC